MGRSQRQKGSRVERLLRDELRKHGFEADRAPLSGAAQGFKGDVRGVKDGRTFTFEVKARATAFKTIYDLFNDFHEEGVLRMMVGRELIIIANSFAGTQTVTGTYQEAQGRLANRILNLRKLLGEAQILAIKGDREPFLYLAYLGVVDGT